MLSDRWKEPLWYRCAQVAIVFWGTYSIATAFAEQRVRAQLVIPMRNLAVPSNQGGMTLVTNAVTPSGVVVLWGRPTEPVPNGWAPYVTAEKKLLELGLPLIVKE